MKTLYLFRHGETVRDADGFHTDESPLTNDGKNDIRDTFEQLVKSGLSVDRSLFIAIDSTKRIEETAQIIVEEIVKYSILPGPQPRCVFNFKELEDRFGRKKEEVEKTKQLSIGANFKVFDIKNQVPGWEDLEEIKKVINMFNLSEKIIKEPYDMQEENRYMNTVAELSNQFIVTGHGFTTSVIRAQLAKEPIQTIGKISDKYPLERGACWKGIFENGSLVGEGQIFVPKRLQKSPEGIVRRNKEG